MTTTFKENDLVQLENTIESGTPPFTAVFKKYDGTVIKTFEGVSTMNQIVNYILTLQDTVFTLELTDSCKDGAKSTIKTQEIIVEQENQTMDATMNITVNQPEHAFELVLKQKKSKLTITVKDETGALVSGATISLDNVVVGTTDVNGICIILNVSYGTHVLYGIK